MKGINTDKDLTVFISYSWDNEVHKEWTLNLADKLIEKGGLDVIFDRYDLIAGKSMTHFMETSVNKADKVLLVMTPKFKEKADSRKGGVGYETSMVTQELYERQDNEKFIPILRCGSASESAPNYLKSYIFHDMTNDLKFDDDVNNLIKLIYDEPTLKKPLKGKKPDFTFTEGNLINDTKNLQYTGMTAFANWNVEFQLHSLANFNKSNLYQKINSNLLFEEGMTLPLIFHNSLKISHYPDIVYERPLSKFLADNHLVQEKLKIDDGLISYEFSEYSNHDFWLLFISQPFLSIFYLLIIVNSVHKQLGKPIEITLSIRFRSNRTSYLYSTHSPFKYPHIFHIQKMQIPGMKADIKLSVDSITSNSLFDIFEKIYGVFVAENSKSAYPFVTLDKDNFDIITEKFLK